MNYDPVSHPEHYECGMCTTPVQCIDITRHMSFAAGNAFKYVWRAGRKCPAAAMEDLDKAEWYLEDQLEHHPGFASVAGSAVFAQITPQPTKRYLVLRHIVEGEYRCALDLLPQLRDEVWRELNGDTMEEPEQEEHVEC